MERDQGTQTIAFHSRELNESVTDAMQGRIYDFRRFLVSAPVEPSFG
jgi:hypothetical protein